MFNRPTTSNSPTNLIPILSTDQLLGEKRRPELISDLARLSGFAPVLFNTLCTRLIHHFANRCQRLPESTVYFGQLGGFLDHSLQRTHAAMNLFRQYLLTNPQDTLSTEQQQWWYALFSASVLRGIGRLCLDYKVERYSLKGQFLKQWQPLLEPLGQLGQAYQVALQTHADLAFRHRITLILARVLMPDSGFELLVSNPAVFAVWLALLEEDSVAAGALGAILDRADSIVIQEELINLPVQLIAPRTERRAPISSFIDNTPEPHGEKDKLMAIEFIRWLTNALERGQLLVNKAPILAIPGGLLILPEAFQLFSREHAHYKNWQSVRQSLMSLPLYPADQVQAASAQHEQYQGLLMPGQLLIPEKLSNQPSATQLALADYPLKLSAQGQWVKPLPQQSIQPTQQTRRG